MSDINWPTVGVAWALSVTSSVVVYVVILVVYLRVKRSRVRRRTRGQQNVGVAHIDVTKSLIYKPETPETALKNNRRICNDDVSRWCNSHCLPEAIVTSLRQNGFTSLQALDGLRANDVTGLHLPNQALAVQLRAVLENKATTSSTASSPAASPPVTSPGGSSMHSQLTSSTQPLLTSPLRTTAIGSSSSDDTRSHRSRDSSRRSGRHKNNDVIFHGMLSDSGLHRLSGRLGNEWQHLATELGITYHTVQRLIRAHVGALDGAIYEMLHQWREGALGGKEQVKGQLYTALSTVGRNDLAQELHREQLRGSSDAINRQISLY